MPAWLVRTMMVKDYVAFYGGVMIKYVWLSNLQFEEISIYSWRCFLKAIGPKNANPASILEHPHVYTLGEICSGAIFTHTANTEPQQSWNNLASPFRSTNSLLKQHTSQAVLTGGW